MAALYVKTVVKNQRVVVDACYPYSDRSCFWKRVAPLTQGMAYTLAGLDLSKVHGNGNSFLNKGYVVYATDDDSVFAVYYHDDAYSIIACDIGEYEKKEKGNKTSPLTRLIHPDYPDELLQTNLGKSEAEVEVDNTPASLIARLKAGDVTMFPPNPEPTICHYCVGAGEGCDCCDEEGYMEEAPLPDCVVGSCWSCLASLIDDPRHGARCTESNRDVEPKDTDHSPTWCPLRRSNYPKGEQR